MTMIPITSTANAICRDSEETKRSDADRNSPTGMFSAFDSPSGYHNHVEILAKSLLYVHVS